jgi:hypothetical protein
MRKLLIGFTLFAFGMGCSTQKQAVNNKARLSHEVNAPVSAERQRIDAENEDLMLYYDSLTQAILHPEPLPKPVKPEYDTWNLKKGSSHKGNKNFLSKDFYPYASAIQVEKPKDSKADDAKESKKKQNGSVDKINPILQNDNPDFTWSFNKTSAYSGGKNFTSKDFYPGGLSSDQKVRAEKKPKLKAAKKYDKYKKKQAEQYLKKRKQLQKKRARMG